MKNLKPILLILSLAAAPLAQAITPVEPPKTNPQVAGYYQYNMGNMQITALLDGTNYLSPNLFKGLTEQESQDILKKYYAVNDKGVQTSVNAFLVNDGMYLHLVDTGAASCFGDHLGSVYDNLVASGHQPEKVDTIVLTHLHPDHICGISKDGADRYPNARIFVSETEYDYWLGEGQAEKMSEAKRAGFIATVEKIKQALQPYQDRRVVFKFNKDQKIDRFTVIESKGHTPGHHGFSLKSQDQEIVFIGDIVHSHTLQFERPETAVNFDIDPEQAVQTRLKYFAEYAKDGQTIAAPHLPFPGIGHIYSKDGKSYQWIPVHFKNW